MAYLLVCLLGSLVLNGSLVFDSLSRLQFWPPDLVLVYPVFDGSLLFNSLSLDLLIK